MKPLLMVGCSVLLALSFQARADDKVDFVKQIKPLFADSCYKCHAGSKHKGDFKLDSIAAIKKGGKEAKDKVLIPGNAEKSDLYRRLFCPRMMMM